MTLPSTKVRSAALRVGLHRPVVMLGNASAIHEVQLAHGIAPGEPDVAYVESAILQGSWTNPSTIVCHSRSMRRDGRIFELRSAGGCPDEIARVGARLVSLVFGDAFPVSR